MKGKQLIYALISIVFFLATGVVVYVNLFSSSPPSVPQLPAPGQSVSSGVSAAQPLLPYGTDLNFSILKQYNSGLIPPFQYEQVTPEQIGVTDPNQLIKSESALQ